MQQVANLYEQVCSFNNLLLAHKKALRGTKTPESLEFDFHREPELLQLQKELQNHSYKPQPYRYFTIFEPKERQISVATYRDRVVHHAIVNVLEPVYEKCFIYHSYATRKNKGTHKAISQTQKYLQNNRWFLKCDIKKYFDSINHEILLGIISKKIKDTDLLQLIASILANAGNGISLPIGNLTSQFFANVYLNGFDHYVKEKLQCKFYIRYMDDFVLFAKNKERVKAYRQHITNYVTGLGLTINPNSSFINQKCNGLSFLGVRIFHSLVRVKKENLKRSLNRIKTNSWLLKNKRELSEAAYFNSINSIFAHLENYSTLQFRRKWIKENGYLA